MSDPRVTLTALLTRHVPSWEDEAADLADAILAAGWTPPTVKPPRESGCDCPVASIVSDGPSVDCPVHGEHPQCDHERAARELARTTPLSIEDVERLFEATVKLDPPSARPTLKDVARIIDPNALDGDQAAHALARARAVLDTITAPVKPSVETVAQSLALSYGSHVNPPKGGRDWRAARAVLDLFPGRTEADVRAEVVEELDKFAAEIDAASTSQDPVTIDALQARRAGVLAARDRIAKKEAP